MRKWRRLSVVDEREAEMTMKRLMIVVLVAVGVALLGSLGALAGSGEVTLSDSEALGKEVFFDEILSLN